MTSRQIPSDVNKASTIELWGEKNSAKVWQIGGSPLSCDLLIFPLTCPVTTFNR